MKIDIAYLIGLLVVVGLLAGAMGAIWYVSSIVMM